MSAEPNIIRLNQDLAVTGQLGPEHAAAIAQAGFKSLVNNRPDFEGGGSQATADSVGQAVRALGLQFESLPIPPANFTIDDARQMRRLLETLPKPMLAYCRTGTRSAKLIQVAMQLPPE